MQLAQKITTDIDDSTAERQVDLIEVEEQLAPLAQRVNRASSFFKEQAVRATTLQGTSDILKSRISKLGP